MDKNFDIADYLHSLEDRIKDLEDQRKQGSSKLEQTINDIVEKKLKQSTFTAKSMNDYLGY